MDLPDNPAFKPRKSKNDVPIGWTPTTKRGRPEWRCKNVQFVLGHNEYRRCSHICEKRHIKHHKHHYYDILQSEDEDFPKHILKKAQNITHLEFNRRYLNQLAILCGKLDIPCRKAVTNAMRNFTLFLLNEGLEFGRNPNNNSIFIQKCLDKISINQLKDQIINAAQNEFSMNIRNFKNKKYCSLLCDAGTVLSSHCLHFILVYLGEPVLKCFFESYDGDSFDSEFYQNCFIDIFEKLEENNIHICSITTDNLPAQVRGWNTFVSTSYYPFINILYRIPCYAHMLNLVFDDISKNSPFFGFTIKSVLSIVNIIRKPEAVDVIRTKCPKISKTRWLYRVFQISCEK